MFKWYKEKQKQKFEKAIKQNILFNEYRIKYYKAYPNKVDCPIDEFENEAGIAKSFCEDQWNYFSKYQVDKSLWNRQIETYKMAIDELYKAEIRIKEDKKLKKERDKIDICKQAILELKQEGKL